MATINGVPGKGHAVGLTAPGGQWDRTGTLEMTGADAARLVAMYDADEELVYSGPVVIDGARHTETFPVLVRIVTTGGSPASVHFTQSGPPRGRS